MNINRTEIIASALSACAQEMLASLIRTAYSPNIKERGDCSTALCDLEGRTLALAANAPAHLGATLRLVPEILRRFPVNTLKEGDAFLANDPYIVGVTHLNDCTVACPTFVDGQVVGFAVTVAHHSDVGGRVPGSEAGDSNSIFQEGLRVPPVQIMAQGEYRQDLLEMFLLNSRMPEFGKGDLMAQVAAASRGASRVKNLFERYGNKQVLLSIEEMFSMTEKRVRAQIRKHLRSGTFFADDYLDEDGVSGEPVKLAASVTIQDEHITIDLSECDAQIGSGKNVPISHTLATVYCVLKSFLDPDGSINEGLYRTVSVVAPVGRVVNPVAPAAVSSRNITSMILADVLAVAIGQAHTSYQIAYSGPFHGTILAGTDPRTSKPFIDYENFCGGQGATSLGHGMSAVHVYMTNTSNLPVESMEIEFPVQVERYEIREGSGGKGRFNGGDGIIRDLRMNGDHMTVALRSARQRFPARGLHGGEAGQTGAFILNPESDHPIQLPSTSSETPLKKGDLLRILTPGGGGMYQA